MMEERTIKLSLEKAKEYYEAGGELRKIALQAFREDEINLIVLPKTWEEYLEILSMGESYSLRLLLQKYNSPKDCAFIKIENLRRYYRQGWEPNWRDEEQTKYCIVDNDGLEVAECYRKVEFLAFQTQEIAEQFLGNFRDIIIEADIL